MQDKKIMSLIVIILSACSITYELALSYMISVIYGNTITVYSTVIGIYMFFLGAGALFYEKIKKEEPTFFAVETLLAFSAFLSPLFIVWGSTAFDNSSFSFFLSYIPVIIIGFLSGIELPLLISLYEKKFSKVIFLDYIGGLAGTFAFSFLMLPCLGITDIFIYTAALNILSVIIYGIKYAGSKKEKTKILIFVFLLTALFTGKNFYKGFVENLYYTKRLQLEELRKFPTKGKAPSIKINAKFNTKYQEVIDANITLYDDNNNSYKRRCVFLNRNTQYCSDWYKYYHRYLCETPLMFFPKNKKLNVLILGGGDLICADVLLKHPEVNKVTLIDIDRKFVEYEKKHAKEFNGGVWKNPKLKIVYGDAFTALKDKQNKYDIVINDLPVVTNINLLKLASKDFYKKIYSVLKEKGIAATMFNTASEIKQINNYACAGFKKLLLLKGINYKPAKIKYKDYFLFLSKTDKEFKIKNKIFGNRFLNILYQNGTEYDLKCNGKLKINTIFHPDFDLIISKINR